MVAITDEPVPDVQLPFLREELSIGGAPNRPAWREGHAPPEALAATRVAIVGGGISGVLAGVRLARAGVPYTIFERSDEPGGMWRDNAYPGCRVDTPNHVYSYSFAPRPDWPAGFSTRDVLRGYVAEVAERFGVAPRIRLGRAVRSGAWDEAAGLWRLEIDGPDGPERFEATVVVLATGQLNVPPGPRPAGARELRGPALPFRALGPLGRPLWRADRRDRHGRERHPVRPRDRPLHGVADDPAALAALARAHARLPPPGPRGGGVADAPRAALRRLAPLLAFPPGRLRRLPRPAAHRSRLAGGGRGERRQRRAAPAVDGLPARAGRGRRDAAGTDRARLSALRQAAVARQRLLGGDAAPAERGTRDRPRGVRRGPRRAPRHGAADRGRRVDLRHGVQGEPLFPATWSSRAAARSRFGRR